MEVRADVLCEIARKAGRAILTIYNDPEADLGVEAKSDDSPLTKADKESNEVICNALASAYPEIPVLSEENKSVDYCERKDWREFFLIDPLDGTKEFIKKNGEFTVNIALIKHGQPTKGVVYVPVSEDMYFVNDQGEAIWENKRGEKRQIRVNKYDKSEKNVKIVCSRSHMNEETQRFVAQFNNPQLISAGSSLKFMLVARGDADVYPRLGPTMEWDTGAADAIVRAANGAVQTLDHEPLAYNKENLLNPFFIVNP